MLTEERDAFVAAVLAVILKPIFWLAFVLAVIVLLIGEPVTLPDAL